MAIFGTEIVNYSCGGCENVKDINLSVLRIVPLYLSSTVSNLIQFSLFIHKLH